MTSQRGAKPKATPSLPGIHVVRAKGKTYFYAWRGGPRMETHPSDPVKFALEYAHHHSKKEDTYDAFSGDGFRRSSSQDSGFWPPAVNSGSNCGSGEAGGAAPGAPKARHDNTTTPRAFT